MSLLHLEELIGNCVLMALSANAEQKRPLLEWFCNQEPAEPEEYRIFWCYLEFILVPLRDHWKLQFSFQSDASKDSFIYKIHRPMQQDLHTGKYINPGLQYIFLLFHCQVLKSLVLRRSNSVTALENMLPLLFWRTGIEQEEAVSAFFDPVHPSGRKRFWKREDN